MGRGYHQHFIDGYSGVFMQSYIKGWLFYERFTTMPSNDLANKPQVFDAGTNLKILGIISYVGLHSIEPDIRFQLFSFGEIFWLHLRLKINICYITVIFSKLESCDRIIYEQVLGR